VAASEFPALEQLLAGYLNLDWPDQFDSVWAGVDAFVRDEGLESVGRVRAEVALIEGRDFDEEELRGLLVEGLGCGYWPPGFGVDVHGVVASVGRAAGCPRGGLTPARNLLEAGSVAAHAVAVADDESAQANSLVVVV
jgi:hypothetical protein